MPTTPPTIVAPLPHDPRVMLLAQATGLTRREAFGAAAEAWAWLAVMATDDAIVKATPDALTALVDVAGFGSAMITAGLVGVVDDGLVLPAELRRLERDQRSVRGGKASADGADDLDDQTRRRRAGDRSRQRRHRATKRNMRTIPEPSPPPASAPPAEDRMPRRLGTVEGFPVMLLFSRAGVPFYKLCGSTPTEWTGTVTDPARPSLADAYASILNAMKRGRDTGRATGANMSPTMDAVVSAAAIYRDNRRAAAEGEVRRVVANAAFAEASADDQGDTFESVTERDCHAPVTPVVCDTVTVTVVSRPESMTCPPNASDDRDFGSVTCHAPVTEPAPSSSSSLSVSGDEEKKTTTTTSSVTPADRDHEDEILDRMLAVPGRRGGSVPTDLEGDPRRRAEQERRQQRDARIAEALGIDVATVRIRNPIYLEDQCRQAGIDFRTGYPVNADAPDEPSDARSDIDMTTEPSTGDKPATGVVAAREPDEPDERDYNSRSKVERLQMACTTLRAATAIGAEAPTMKLIDADAPGDVLPVALG
jgi:hypothetical protein